MMNYLDYFKIILIDILIKNSGNKKKIQDISSKLVIEIPTKKTFGELSTNIAMVFAKVFRMSPIELAKIISDELSKDQYVRDIKIDGPGFINLFLKKFWHQQLKFSIQNINGYEYSLKSKKICVEFVSANPTGMMHIGHARGAVLGDTISSVLEEVGHKVYREYYINDAGQQIKKLFKTIKYHINNPTANPADFPDELYPGSYLVKIAKKIEKLSKSKNEKEACQYIINLIMEDIKKDLLKIKVKHDKFVSEKELANKNNIEKIKQKLLK